MSSMQPGEYDGSVPFEIELEKVPVEKADWTTLAPGLYDDNFQLVATMSEFCEKMIDKYEDNSDYISRYDNDVTIKKYDLSFYPTATTFVDCDTTDIVTSTKYPGYTIHVHNNIGGYADGLNVKNFVFDNINAFNGSATMTNSNIENVYIKKVTGVHNPVPSDDTTFKGAKNVYYNGTIEQARIEFQYGYTTMTNLKSATWHCSDGDFVPASD